MLSDKDKLSSEKPDLQALIVKLASVEIIEPVKLRDFDKLDLERREEEVASLIGKYLSEMELLRSVLLQVKNIISFNGELSPETHYDNYNHNEVLDEKIN